MLPDQLAKSNTEHAHQTAFFAWCAVAYLYGFNAANIWASGFKDWKLLSIKNPIPALKWIHAIPNGGSRGDTAESRAIRGGQLKAEGVRSGVSDICWPYQNDRGFSGIYIEMKRPSLKRANDPFHGLTEQQLEFKNYVLGQTFCWEVCYSWREAADAVQLYY